MGWNQPNSGNQSENQNKSEINPIDLVEKPARALDDCATDDGRCWHVVRRFAREGTAVRRSQQLRTAKAAAAVTIFSASPKGGMLLLRLPSPVHLCGGLARGLGWSQRGTGL
eukprot:SAG31_NODE_11913_length_986_cov_2.373168_1_plen_111_part_01